MNTNKTLLRILDGDEVVQEGDLCVRREKLEPATYLGVPASAERFLIYLRPVKAQDIARKEAVPNP